jgi:hypothetical protein
MNGTGVSQIQTVKGNMFPLIRRIEALYIISNIIHTYKHIQNMYPKEELVEETKGGGKRRKERQ